MRKRWKAVCQTASGGLLDRLLLDSLLLDV